MSIRSRCAGNICEAIDLYLEPALDEIEETAGREVVELADMNLLVLSGRQVLATLQRLGFAELHRKGSHVKLKHPDGRLIVFPFQDEVDRYTLKGTLRDVEITVEEFLKEVR